MRILQVAHALTLYDAASMFALKLGSMLEELGYDSTLFSPKIDHRLAITPFGKNIHSMDDFSGKPDDILIYHLTTGTSFNRFISNYQYPIVLYYHNITPPQYFWGNAWGSWLKCLSGRRDLKKILKNCFFAWAASEYSRQELCKIGIGHGSEKQTEAIRRLPIVIDKDKFANAPPVDTIERQYNDGRTNFLVVGRGVPHKKQDDAIRFLAAYRQNYDISARLFIIGSLKENYAKKLHRLVTELNLDDAVIFTGSVSHDELAAYYRIATALLSFSRHEGFCVPPIEAMLFEVPVFAYAAAALPETVGMAGILFNDPSPDVVSHLVHENLQYGGAEKLKQRLSPAMREKINAFSYETIKRQLAKDMDYISDRYKKLMLMNH